jgi:outer membrane receptor protein involved in Fe transport
VGLSARPTAKILAAAWVESNGPRTIDRAGTENPSFTIVNAKLDVRFSRTFGLYVKGTNLLNRSYTPWVGYPMLPIQAYGGFTLLF